MTDPDEPIDAERDLARMGLPPDTDVRRLSRRFTDALIEPCRERLETAAEPTEPPLIDPPTALEAARLGL
jgi:hypothetical protein